MTHAAHLEVDVEALHDLMQVRKYLGLIVEWDVVEVVEDEQRRMLEFRQRRVEHSSNQDRGLVQPVHLVRSNRASTVACFRRFGSNCSTLAPSLRLRLQHAPR